jgi:hypothetical protein
VNTRIGFTAMLLFAATGAGLAAVAPRTAPSPAQTAQPAAQSSQKHQAAQLDDEGERIFEQNCSRCHNAPEGFSTRISGTIVRHMRVRANLSRHDEQILMKYFNP